MRGYARGSNRKTTNACPIRVERPDDVRVAAVPGRASQPASTRSAALPSTGWPSQHPDVARSFHAKPSLGQAVRPCPSLSSIRPSGAGPGGRESGHPSPSICPCPERRPADEGTEPSHEKFMSATVSAVLRGNGNQTVIQAVTLTRARTHSAPAEKRRCLRQREKDQLTSTMPPGNERTDAPKAWWMSEATSPSWLSETWACTLRDANWSLVRMILPGR